MAQLVERSLPTSDIHGSNPNIDKFYLPIVQLNRRDENKEKEAGNGPSLKKAVLRTVVDFFHFVDQEEADRKRRDEFKRYEMEKKFEHDQVRLILRSRASAAA